MGELVWLLPTGTPSFDGNFKEVPIVGIDYRDKPQNGIAMLERMGNPFILTIDDSRGEFAMQLGVDGAPETYIVDEHGMIRYRHSGYMDRETWLTEIKPKLDELTKSKMKKLTRFLTALLLTFALLLTQKWSIPMRLKPSRSYSCC